MNMKYNKNFIHFFALITAGIVAFCVINLWRSEVLASSNEQGEFVQLPREDVFTDFVRDHALFELVEKTGLIRNLYGHTDYSKLLQDKDPQQFENILRAVESAYAEYSMVEGNHPSRVRLVMKTKPMVYAELLKKYPELLAQVPARSKEICDRCNLRAYPKS